LIHFYKRLTLPEMPEATKTKTVSMDDPVVVTWRDMVHNKDISNQEIKLAYKDFAAGYDTCFNTIHPNRAEHMVNDLVELVEKSGKNIARVKVLDVAAGTGIVGKALWDAGFRHITALDFSEEMLEVAKEKGAYEDFIVSPMGNVIPEDLKPKSFDCVIMVGGFAAGHVPLTSLHTMSRLCVKGGIVANSMTLQYSHFVEEYKCIDKYVEELEEAGVWKIRHRKIMDDYIKGKQGLVHVMEPL